MQDDRNCPDDSGRSTGCRDRDGSVSGIVYLLTNEAMPGLIKIGRTKKDDPQARIDELYNGSPGVPVPFECVLAMRVDDPPSVERELHNAFGPDRVNPKREFFKMDPERAIGLLRIIGSEDVTPKVVNEANDALQKEDKDAVIALRKRRPNLNFKVMGIQPGSILNAVGREESVIVVNDRKVCYRDEDFYLTGATKKCFDLGRDAAPMPGKFWKYEGKLLQDIYDQIYFMDDE